MISKRTFRTHDFSGQLQVVASVNDRAMSASLRELRAQDDLIVALRGALAIGVPIDELSAETGLAPEAIRKMAMRNLTFGEDLRSLSGDPR